MSQEMKGELRGNRPPVVSVIVPAYNAASYIGEALDSIFGQSFRDYQVIVVNDGSPDTAELEEILLKYRNQIVYIKQENRGPSAARNAGMRSACGQYLAFLDSDDIWLPDFLAVLLRFLEEQPEVDLACADCVFFGDAKWNGRSWQSLVPLHEPVTFEKLLPTHGGAFPSFVLLRRDTALKVGFFEEELRILEDYQYWLRLLYCGGKMAYVREILGKRRVHPGSATYNDDVVLSTAAHALETLKVHLSPASAEAAFVKKEVAFVHARHAIREGRRRLDVRDYGGASDWFKKAYQVVPSNKLRFVLLGLRWFPWWTRWTIGRWDQHSNVNFG